MLVKNSIIENKILTKGRKKSVAQYPSFYESSLNNSLNKKRPLNSTSSELSFKGLSLNSAKKVFKDVPLAIEKYAKIFGEKDAKFFKDDIDDLVKKGVAVLKDDTITISQKSVAKSIAESIVYPIKGMPRDFAEFFLKTAKKVPGLKKSQTLDNLLQSKFILKGKEDALNHAKAASVVSFFQKVKNGDLDRDIFRAGHNRLNPMISNYSTDKERALTRVVTGLIPAAFLGNDAYNLTRLVNDNEDEAKKEKNRRIKQEVTRIGINAYATFVTMGALKKVINTNPLFSIAATTGVVLISETLSRKLMHKPITFISEKKAKELGDSNKEKDSKKSDVSSTVSTKQEPSQLKPALTPSPLNESSFNPVVFKSSEIIMQTPPDVFKNFAKNTPIVSFSKKEEEQNDKKDKSSLWPKVVAVVGGLWVLGFASNKIKATEHGKKLVGAVSEQYKKIITQKDLISREDFNSAISKVRKNGFEETAQRYENIIKDQTGEMIDLGRKNRKVIHPFVNEVVMFPIRTVWKWAMMPYNFTKTIGEILTNKTAKLRDSDTVIKTAIKNLSDSDLESINSAKRLKKDLSLEQISHLDETLKSSMQTLTQNNELKKLKVSADSQQQLSELRSSLLKKVYADNSSDKKMLSNSIAVIKKMSDDKNFAKTFHAKRMDSFDEQTKSTFPNHNLSKITKLTSSAVTSYFLIADNYNLVMQKNQNKGEAVDKAKERALQRGYGIVYGAFLISFLNNIFKGTYNRSLLGASFVNSIYAIVNETLTRISIGLPIREKSKDEILTVEKKNVESDGLKGKYFRLMKTITGKKQLSQKKEAKKS